MNRTQVAHALCIAAVTCLCWGQTARAHASVHQSAGFFRNLSRAKTVPLRDATFRKFQYTVKLIGGAINGIEPYEIHFDTGSWTTSIPYGSLDRSKLTVLTQNFKDPWGNLADKVSGRLSVKSVDGTPYTIDEFVFFALKNPDGTPMADDRTEPFGHGIMGAFPSLEPGRHWPSLPYALARKYAPEDTAIAIISDLKTDIGSEWNTFHSYLQFGCPKALADKLNWRTDIPLWQTDLDFCPEAVPGFKVRIGFRDTDQVIDTPLMMATIDTGAPDLTLRLNSANPQYRKPFANHFIRDGAWKAWNNAEYLAGATTLIEGRVTVEFTDSSGTRNSFSFFVGTDLTASPISLFAGSWESGVPWPANTRDKPQNRINLGNTVYFFCPAVVYDVKNKRVGFAFR